MREPITKGRGIWTAIVATVLLTGCDRGAPPAPPAPPPASRPAPRAPRAQAPTQDAQAPAPDATRPIDVRPARDALASVHGAPALGLIVDARTSVDVDLYTGQATLRETDAALTLGLGLRRARTGDADAPGLFGRGWRSEAEATLHALDDGFMAMRRVEGVVLFGAVKDGLWATVRGEVEWLTRTAEGYEVQDPAGRLHRFDAAGRLTEVLPGFKVERAPGELRLVGGVETITLTLDAQGRATRATGRGVDLGYEYDARGDLVAVRGTRTARYVYEEGHVVQVHGARGQVLALAYDDAWRLARANDQVYRFAKGAVEVDTPRGAWRYTDDGAGWRVETPEGVERVVIDDRCRIVSVQREGQPAQRVERDRHGRHRLGRGLGARSSAVREVEHDARAQVDAVTTPGGRRWSFERDDDGQVVREVSPAGAVELTRDAEGRRATRRDGAGREVTAIRDARGLIEELVAGDGAAITFTHDDAGRLLSAGGDAEQVSFTWDPAVRDRLLAVETPDAVLRYTHGPDVERVDTPWGELARTSDARGLVERLDTPAGAFTFEHDAAGRRVAVTYPNGVMTRLDRDAHGRVAAIAADGPAGPVLALVHERADDGRIVATTRDGETTRYGHDARGRLTSATAAAGARRWTVDGDGVREQGGLEHDASGRLVRRASAEGETRYGYDAFGRLVEVTTPAGDVVRYAYDGLGRVVARTTDAGTTRFLYERGQLLAEVGPGDRARVWLHGPSTDEPLAYIDVIEGLVGDWVYLHTDALGTVLAYSDEEGALVDRAALDPWGEVLEAPAGDRAVLFAGRQVDVETGLVDLRARFYAPELGRFLEPDPAGLDGGPAPHVYADGRPLERRDPLGLWPWEGVGEGALLDEQTPSAVETAASSLVGWLVGAAIDLAPTAHALTSDASARLKAGGVALRDARLQLVRSGLVAGRGSDRPYGSDWTAVNLLGDAAQALGEGALSVVEGTLSSAGELITPDGEGAAVAQAFGEGYKDGAREWSPQGTFGALIREGQEKQVRRVDALMDAGLSPLGALANTATVLTFETVIPAVPAWEARTGRDFSALVDESRDRRLTNLERAGRAAEVAADLAGAGIAVKASRAAKAARAADALADARRATRAAHADDALAAAPKPRAPQDGLAQALDPETPRGAGPAPDAPAAQPRAPPEAAATPDDGDCVFVRDERGNLVRLGNFLEEPRTVLDQLRKRRPAEVLVSDLEEAQALKHALRRERMGFPRPQIFTGAGVTRAQHARSAVERAQRNAALWAERRRMVENAVEADYPKHNKARTETQAEKMSMTGKEEGQYLPGLRNRPLERRALHEALNRGRAVLRVREGNTLFAYYRHTDVVGYSLGKETRWIRAEITSGNAFHGHPRSAALIEDEIGKAAFRALGGE